MSDSRERRRTLIETCLLNADAYLAEFFIECIEGQGLADSLSYVLHDVSSSCGSSLRLNGCPNKYPIALRFDSSFKATFEPFGNQGGNPLRELGRTHSDGDDRLSGHFQGATSTLSSGTRMRLSGSPIGVSRNRLIE